MAPQAGSVASFLPSLLMRLMTRKKKKKKKKKSSMTLPSMACSTSLLLAMGATVGVFVVVAVVPQQW